MYTATSRKEVMDTEQDCDEEDRLLTYMFIAQGDGNDEDEAFAASTEQPCIVLRGIESTSTVSKRTGNTLFAMFEEDMVEPSVALTINPEGTIVACVVKTRRREYLKKLVEERYEHPK